MKKCLLAFLASFLVLPVLLAQEQQEATTTAELQREETRTISPVMLAFGGDSTIDIIGLRLGIWGHCHDLTGLDLSIGGEAQNAYGLQIALIRNRVNDVAGTLQIAVGWNVAQELSGVQIAPFWNESLVMRGLQVGLVNSTSDMRGLQVGLINAADTTYGYQIGLINVIKGSRVPFFPGINFQFTED